MLFFLFFSFFFGFQAEQGLLCSPAPRSRLVCTSPRALWHSPAGQSWPPPPADGGGLTTRSPSLTAPDAPQHQTGNPSPCNHCKGITVLVQLPQSDNPPPAATASPVTHRGTSSICPERRQRLPLGQQSHSCHTWPPQPPRGVRHRQGCVTADFAPATTRLHLWQRKPWGR